MQAVLYANLAQFDEHYLEDPRIAHAVPPDLAAWFATPEGGWLRKQILDRNGGGMPPVSLVTAIRSYDQVVRYLAESDARLVFGSDTPATQSYGALPGFSGRLEMNHWIGAGVSEAQLFRALTIDNARAFGLDDEIGTIEEGKLAHLLLLHANPLKTVDAYDAIDVVVLRGVPIERDEVSALRK
jgi:N-acyl-D-aspartate/D-glutamate deacylase